VAEPVEVAAELDSRGCAVSLPTVPVLGRAAFLVGTAFADLAALSRLARIESLVALPRSTVASIAGTLLAAQKQVDDGMPTVTLFSWE
jgi:hypothetical protein